MKRVKSDKFFCEDYEKKAPLYFILATFVYVQFHCECSLWRPTRYEKYSFLLKKPVYMIHQIRQKVLNCTLGRLLGVHGVDGRLPRVHLSRRAPQHGLEVL